MKHGGQGRTPLTEFQSVVNENWKSLMWIECMNMNYINIKYKQIPTGHAPVPVPGWAHLQGPDMLQNSRKRKQRVPVPLLQLAHQKAPDMLKKWKSCCNWKAHRKRKQKVPVPLLQLAHQKAPDMLKKMEKLLQCTSLHIGSPESSCLFWDWGTKMLLACCRMFTYLVRFLSKDSLNFFGGWVQSSKFRHLMI